MSGLMSNRERFATFESWPLDFLSPQRMSKCGFFYTRRGDIVKCAYCGVEIGDWLIDDDPWNEHFKHSPSCSFVKDNLINEKYVIIKLDGSISSRGRTIIKNLSIVTDQGIETQWDLRNCDVCGIWENTVPIQIIKNQTKDCRWVLSEGREACAYLERVLNRSVYDVNILGNPKDKPPSLSL